MYIHGEVYLTGKEDEIALYAGIKGGDVRSWYSDSGKQILGFLSPVDLPFHGDTENDLSICGKGEGGAFLREGRGLAGGEGEK